MKDYVIVTDTTCDLPSEIAQKLNVQMLPLRVFVDEEEIFTKEHSISEFYDMLKNGKQAKTTQINVSTFCIEFEKILQQGKDILYISLSSGISGSYNSACAASNDLSCKYPDNKIIVIDSLSASLGEGLLIYKAAMKKISGCSIDDVSKWVESNKKKICHLFTVDDLFHLKRGGRISKTSALVGTMLGIKPILTVNDEGCLIPVKKVRGRQQSLKALVDGMRCTINIDDNSVVAVSHSDVQGDVQVLTQIIKQAFPFVKEIIIGYVNPVIGAHSGPGTISVFFQGSHR